MKLSVQGGRSTATVCVATVLHPDLVYFPNFLSDSSKYHLNRLSFEMLKVARTHGKPVFVREFAEYRRATEIQNYAEVPSLWHIRVDFVRVPSVVNVNVGRCLSPE
jgi:hypothetical protein